MSINKKESRLVPVFRNTVFGAFNILLTLILNFISRKLFLNYIGLEYLSVNQVVSSILTVLTFSEAGLASAAVYLLYKPVAEGDHDSINRILKLYRKVTRWIAFAVLCIGLVLLPFLHFFINVDTVSHHDVMLIFMMYVVDTSLSYLFSYRVCLFSADQKAYIPSMINTFVSLIRLFLQCGTIYFTHNYFAYLAVTLGLNFLTCLIQYFLAAKYYPFLNENSAQESLPQEKKHLLGSVKAMLSINLSNIVINNTDNILVSAIDTIMVGYCANYISITGALESFLNNMYQALMHGMGNYSVNASSQQRHEIFKHILFINDLLTTFTTICVAVLANDFVVIVFGKQYTISILLFASIVLKYFWKMMNAPIWIFRDANGLFDKAKGILAIDAAMNIVLSVLLGKIIGVSGVYYATVISDLFTNFYFTSRLIYRESFQEKNNSEFISKQLITLVQAVILIGICMILTKEMPSTIIFWMIKLLICIAVFICFVFVRYRKDPEYAYAKDLLHAKLSAQRGKKS